MSEKLQVWSCGGGTQSCAIAALIVQGKLPKPDFAVIADTGYEVSQTWNYARAVLVPELKKVGVILERVASKEWSLPWAQGIMAHSKNTSGPLIPVFSTVDNEGKTKNFCTKGWKTEAIKRYLSQTHHITRSKYQTWVGFSLDEPLRWMKMMRGKEYAKGLLRFPLVHDVPMKRRDAIALVESMGWGTPPRSACWMCPNHSDYEWRKLKAECPNEFQKAVELEREIHKVDPDAWLHRSCVPLDQVDFSQPEDLFSRPCDSGQCFV